MEESQSCDPQDGDKQGPAEALERFTTLLGSFWVDVDHKPSIKGKGQGYDAVLSGLCSNALEGLLSENEFDNVSFPCLSLGVHSTECSGSDSRQQVENVAASQLSRPLLVHRETIDKNTPPHDEQFQQIKKEKSNKFHSRGISSVPGIILSNICSSFAVLVDARLRAYGAVLKEHAKALLEAGYPCDLAASSALKKMCALLDVFKNIFIKAAVTNFHIVESSNNDTVKRQDDKCQNTSNSIIDLPLIFEATIDVQIPYLTNSDMTSMTVNINAPGLIIGQFVDVNPTQSKNSSHLLKSATIKLDTHLLLSSIIDQARLVVSQAIQNVSFAQPCELTSELIDNDTSTSPVQNNNFQSSHGTHVMVSPDLLPGRPILTPPPIQNNTTECNEIIDFLIGEIDQECLSRHYEWNNKEDNKKKKQKLYHTQSCSFTHIITN